eukprot:8760781-Alexandrium_andersonii.AAC.1
MRALGHKKGGRPFAAGLNVIKEAGGPGNRMHRQRSKLFGCPSIRPARILLTGPQGRHQLLGRYGLHLEFGVPCDEGTAL